MEQTLSPTEADQAFKTLNSEQFPWNLKPKLYGYKLDQHAYTHTRDKKGKKKASISLGLQLLEEICTKLEGKFDGKISEVYCNRFRDPTHNIPFHKDTFGRHIMVLSLGSTRTVQFRHNKSNAVTNVRPNSGDVYFMPLKINDNFQHCVSAADEQDSDEEWDMTRLSFVFFFECPKFASEYKISTRDKMKGYFETLLAG